MRLRRRRAAGPLRAARARVYWLAQFHIPKCDDEDSRDEPIFQRAGGCCEPVVGGPNATSEQFGANVARPDLDDLQAAAGQ